VTRCVCRHDRLRFFTFLHRHRFLHRFLHRRARGARLPGQRVRTPAARAISHSRRRLQLARRRRVHHTVVPAGRLLRRRRVSRVSRLSSSYVPFATVSKDAFFSFRSHIRIRPVRVRLLSGDSAHATWLAVIPSSRPKARLDRR